jgi:hypothetical protein|tara:strand:- start:474 stop:809 length:336 start_codon:yes stop_codon:yes gene_type:complete
MKKYITTLLLIFLFSCQKDYIEDINQINFFDSDEQIIYNDQVIDFSLPNDGTYYFVLVDIDGYLLAREKFDGTKGKNSRTVYSSLLNVDQVYLMLYNNNQSKLQEVLLKLK